MNTLNTIIQVVFVLAATFGMGVAGAFPFLGMAAQKNPRHGAALLGAGAAIHKMALLPAAAVELIAGVLLVLVAGVSLSQGWLMISAIVFVIVFGFDLILQLPNERKLLALFQGNPESLTPEIKKTANAVSAGGMLMTLGIVAIAILVVWRP